MVQCSTPKTNSSLSSLVRYLPSGKLTVRTWKWWFRRWFSFSRGVFSGSMLIFRGVWVFKKNASQQNGAPWGCPWRLRQHRCICFRCFGCFRPRLKYFEVMRCSEKGGDDWRRRNGMDRKLYLATLYFFENFSAGTWEYYTPLDKKEKHLQYKHQQFL